ncbi:MAG: chemotaxis protein CheA [bacterium]
MTDNQMTDFSQDEELFAIFLEEVREILETLDQSLVQLEREPHNVALIQGIFRAAHTLKGSSGAMGLKNVASLTHAMEDVLDKVRNNAIDVTADVADALLKALDRLHEFEGSLKEGKGEGKVDDKFNSILSELKNIASGAGAITVKSGVSSESLGKLSDNQLAVLVDIALDCQMPSIRAYMVIREMEKLGEIQKTVPAREQIDAGVVGHRLLMAVTTECPEEIIRQKLTAVSEIEWVRISQGKAASSFTLDMPARNKKQVDEEAEASQVGVGVVQQQQTVRVNVDILDNIMNLVGELVLSRTRMVQIKDDLGEAHPTDERILDLDIVTQQLGSVVSELHAQVLQARMLPVSSLFNRYPRMIRDICRTMNKEVDFQITGENELLDRSVIEKLVDPLTHLLRNAVDHGMEMPDERDALGKPRTGTVKLTAQRQEESVLIRITDDGPGINADRLKEKAIAAGIITQERAASMSQNETFSLIFASGLSTAKAVSDVSGRGVGMDVVKRNIDAINGIVMVESEQGIGTSMTLKIPLTLAILRALVVKVGQTFMAIPLSTIEETLNIRKDSINTIRGMAMMRWREHVVPVIHLIEIMPGCGVPDSLPSYPMIVVRHSDRIAALCVDGIVGHQEIVVKPLGAFVGEIPGIGGSTILGNGKVALIVDIGSLFESGLLQTLAAWEIPADMESYNDLVAVV